ncbi:MAG TPA: hypothetical protein VJT49_10850 [Amycolatopsis sp.]|uniref:hypothetical protein n=1 Tax=Amycolatopsis sp. TaxID=37632 RepID=UPI002B45C209|nr:hypothetical protein [Amycolatopsis sp.]HKS45590.1 hypothetical protein [Amycolatopsis sp.]
MTEAQDPERLLADALRAQARSAPPTGPVPEIPQQFGLLSGPDAGPLERERAALGPPTVQHPVTRPTPVPSSLPPYWVLLLAVLLGLATGSVIGLITLL